VTNYSIQKWLPLRLLLKTVMSTIHATVISQFALCGCGRCFQIRTCKFLHESTQESILTLKDDISGECMILHKEELQDLYGSSDTVMTEATCSSETETRDSHWI